MAKRRSVKVYGQSGYKYRETLTIMLKGLWLKEAGFDIGDYISVTCEDGKIIITQDAERDAVKVADAFDVTLISNNTRHVWYIYNVELKDQDLCLVYHNQPPLS